MEAAAVLDAFSSAAALRHQPRPWWRSTRGLAPSSQACRAAAPFARADWQVACAILASNSSGTGDRNAATTTTSSKQPAPRVNGQTPPPTPSPSPAPALEKTPPPPPTELDLVPTSSYARSSSVSSGTTSPTIDRSSWKSMEFDIQSLLGKLQDVNDAMSRCAFASATTTSVSQKLAHHHDILHEFTQEFRRTRGT